MGSAVGSAVERSWSYTGSPVVALGLRVTPRALSQCASGVGLCVEGGEDVDDCGDHTLSAIVGFADCRIFYFDDE